MIKRAIVVFPESSGLAGVEQLRTRFDPQARLIPAHVTLVFPFESSISTAALQAHLRDVLAGWKPFSIDLGGIRPDGEYIFLDATRGRAELIALHEQLYTGPLAEHRSSEHVYAPHLTVGRVANPTERIAALAAVQSAAPAIASVVRSVSVFRVLDEHRGSVDFATAVGAP